MSIQGRPIVVGALALALTGAALLVKSRFDDDMQLARTHAAQGSVLLATVCGPIEYQEAGSGVPLLAIHGSGGGHDQGLAFAAGLMASSSFGATSIAGGCTCLSAWHSWPRTSHTPPLSMPGQRETPPFG